jgi:hypothetical protein
MSSTKKLGMIKLGSRVVFAISLSARLRFHPADALGGRRPSRCARDRRRPAFPGVLVEVRPIGLLNMIDSGEPDAKILRAGEKSALRHDQRTLKISKNGNPHLLKGDREFL